MKLCVSGLAATVLVFAHTAAANSQQIFARGEGDFSWDSLDQFEADHDYSGESITVFGPWLGADADAAEAVFAYFEEATGATVQHTGSDSFEQQIMIDSEAGSLPNIAIFPQPGLACDLAGRGFLVPLGPETGDWLEETYAAGSSWVSLGTCAGSDGAENVFGLAYNVNLKSLVWYSPENFDDFEYGVPESMEELKALTDQIVDDGETPWCIGLGSGGATGWPATDWVEDLLLRTSPPSVYDQWVTNEIAFDDPAIVAAIEEFGHFARTDAYVAGGASGVAATDFRDSPNGLFSSPPQCFMHRQASFVPAFFPDDVEVGVDVDFFYFPSYDSAGLGDPVVGAGTLVTIGQDSPAARGFIEFLKTPLAHEIWMAIEGGGFLTPHSGANTDVYSDEIKKAQGEILLNATTFRFDGSDLMPGAIGAGAFWTGMIDYVGGKEAADVAGEIQRAWDALK
ncbi:MAG: ABC transporter substrate-binding protein [Pseudomonadota bacterium]